MVPYKRLCGLFMGASSSPHKAAAVADFPLKIRGFAHLARIGAGVSLLVFGHFILGEADQCVQAR